MASFKGYDREDGQKRRQGQRKPRRNGIPRIEFLERRQLLTGSTDVLPAPLWTPSDPQPARRPERPDGQPGGRHGRHLRGVREQRRQHVAARRRIPVDRVSKWDGRAEVKSLGGDFSQFVTQLTDVGMQITTTSATTAWSTVLPRSTSCRRSPKLPQTMSGQVQLQPDLRTPRNYQGVAYNEAETSMFADVARTEFNVDGTGVTIGVLSDSVNQYQRRACRNRTATGDLEPQRSRRRDPGRSE